MARGPSVLLLDDGELDDIQRLLEEVGVPFARVRGGAIVDGTPPPDDLLISTPRRLDAVRKVGTHDDGTAPVRLVVVEEDSNTLRERLRRDGFDYLVRRPVHPEAMRLLVLRCLYRGDERRVEPRVAVGFEVGFRTGLMTRRAVLADLSLRGCRLLSEHRIEPGRRIKVNVPEALEAGEPVAVTGRVLRVDRPKEQDRAHLYSAAVLFENPSRDARQAIELLIEDLSLGPATLRRVMTGGGNPLRDAEVAAAEVSPADETLDAAAPEATPEAETRDTPPEAPASEEPPLEVVVQLDESAGDEDAPETDAQTPSDRRGRRRAAYSHTVPAFGKRALRVLVGRDLSIGGMRIEPLPGLELGDRLHLAIYGEAGESPFLVWASVVRDDGPSGMALAFDPLEEAIGERLERLVSNLPSVESLHDTEAQAMGTVMSEILPE